MAAEADAPSIPNQDLVERYHAMAEELNGRGAMELAVPFYRQAIALLLAERDQLRASADVSGVLAAAAQLEEGGSPIEAPLSPAELQRRVGALEQELCAANRREVATAVAWLEEQWPEPQAQLLGLRAKLHLLEGDLEAARTCFEQAHALDGRCPRLRLNTGAARLADGDAEAALALLRPLTAELEALEPLGPLSSLWKNLAQAELLAGEPVQALRCLDALLAAEPAQVDLALWLEQAGAWLATGELEPAQQLLALLQPHAAAPLLQPLFTLLAEQLEAAGAYREAALLYRQLLRPALSS